MNIRFDFNKYRKISLGFGTVFMFFLIEMTRNSLGWFIGLLVSIFSGLLLSFILENFLNYFSKK